MTSHNSRVEFDWLTYTINQSNLTKDFSAKYVEVHVFDRSIGLNITRPRRDHSLDKSQEMN